MAGRSKDIASSYHYIAVTPSDSTLLQSTTRGLYIGVAGDVSVQSPTGDAAIVFKNVPIGILPIQTTRVNSSLTTATNIVALF